jgi:type IX secretion system PorP/SprF family membrane protein
MSTIAQSYFNNPVSQYFRNQYLWNGAYAGAKAKPFVYGLVNKSWTGFDGAPTLVMLTGDLSFGKNSGAGLQFVSDKSGSLQRTIAKFNYSYKVVMSETENLRLGIGLSGFKERLSSEVTSNNGQFDPTVKSFNDRSWEVDGEFGAVYENSNFSFGASFFNLRTALKNLESRPTDLPVIQLVTSYKFDLQNDLGLKPLASFRHYMNSKNLLTAGAQLEYDKTFHASAMYQTNGSVLGGLGVMLKELGEVNFFYSGNNSQGYGQQYEVALGIHIK